MRKSPKDEILKFTSLLTRVWKSEGNPKLQLNLNILKIMHARLKMAVT